jgi:subtilase family serine protease
MKYLRFISAAACFILTIMPPGSAQQSHSLNKINIQGNIQKLNPNHNTEALKPTSSQDPQTVNSAPNLTKMSASYTLAYPILTIHIQIINNGTETSGASYVACYLSPDFIITTADHQIGINYVTFLEPGAISDETISVNVIDYPGTWYVGFIIDKTNVVVESNENDNAYYISPQMSIPYPNLTAVPNACGYSYTFPELTITARIENTAWSTAGPCEVSFYLSADQTITTEDHRLGQSYLQSLTPGAYSNISNLFSLRHYPGTWYVGFIIDEANEVIENNEGDNTFCFPAQITVVLPNLTYDPAHCSYTFTDPDLTINVRVINNSDGPSNTTEIFYFLSSSPSGGGSRDLDDDHVSSLTPGSFTDLHMTEDVSNFSGTWYVGFDIDPENDVVETTESDNKMIFPDPIEIAPGGVPIFINSDLTDETQPNISYTYPNITFNIEVINAGVISSEQCRLGYYLSSDSDIQTSDILLDHDVIPVLPVGGYIGYINIVNIAEHQGTWYAGFIIDDLHEVTEDHEGNNTFLLSTPITVQTPAPDLMPVDVQIIDYTGPSIIYNLTVKNQGNEATHGSFKNSIFLSTDKTIDKTDVQIDDWNVIQTLAAGQSKNSEAFNTTISGVPAGEYYLGVIADSDQSIDESDEYNNTFCADSPKIIIENQSSEPVIVTNSNDSGTGSLRSAIDQVNANPGPDIILFNIPQADAGYNEERGVWTIQPLTALPVISDSLTIIDGFSQQDFIGDTNPNGLVIELDGSQIVTGIAHGLFIMSAKNTVQGLAIGRFTNSGILLTGPGANDNLLTNNFIGLSAAIDAWLPNGKYGIYIVEGARNQIGRLEETSLGKAGKTRQKLFNMTPEHVSQQYEFTGQNIIASNLDCGIYISGEVANTNQIVNNQVIYNESHGIYLSDRIQGTTIYWNAIAYNAGAGVVVHGENAIQNKIITNMITENGLEGILLEGGNLMLPAPEITLITESFISGTASPEALVQLFGDPEDEGEILFGEAYCNAAGNFTWIGIMSGTNITATATDPNGNTSAFSTPFETGSEVITTEPLPDRFALYHNTPNPFNPSTTIRFQIPEPCLVSLKVYDLLGKEVATLIHEYRAAGSYAVEWNANNLSSGIYICHMNAGAFTGIKKLVLQK